jgi:type III secretion protein V
MADNLKRGGAGAALMAATSRSESVLMIFVVIVLCLMVFPLPPIILDTLISINIILSIALLFLAIGVKSPLELSTFPTLILLTTLFRVSLNIASTKQILLVGDAGHIIDTFGKLVVGGSLLIGAVVFIIISLVQFIVIAKGAERVAEVSARFTLDAMPGKQMSIDSDIRSGSLSKEDAAKRRSELERESQFHGSMDGAMKFVKGDAIAAMIIAGVNVVAGMLVGTVVHELEFNVALARYSILAIGDGMVSQIPSLLSAIAAGVLVTRVGGSEKDGENDNLAGKIGEQFLNQPKVLLYCGLASSMFALVPGFPWYIFLIGGVVLLLGAVRKATTKLADSKLVIAPVKAFQRDGGKQPAQYIVKTEGFHSKPFLLEMAPASVGLIRQPLLVSAIEILKTEVHARTGMMFPGFGLLPNEQLKEGEGRFVIYGVPGARFQIPRESMYLDSDFSSSLLPWNAARYEALLAAATVDADDSVVWVNFTREQLLGAYSILEIVKRSAEFISFQEAQEWLNRANEEYPDVVGEFMRSVPTQRLAEVLKTLAGDGIPLRNPREIVEAVMVFAPKEKDAAGLTEQVRIALGKLIYHGYLGNEEKLVIALIDQNVEEMLSAALGEERTSQSVIGDGFWEKVVTEITESEIDSKAILVVAGSIRRALQEYLRLKGCSRLVLGKAEIPDDAVFDTLHIFAQALANEEIE